MSASLMHQELREAGATVARQRQANHGAVSTLAARLRAAPPVAVLTCARGSSDHAATYAKYLIETRLGIPVASFAPSVASVYRTPLATSGMLALAISQSGKSPDLLAAIERMAAGGAASVALVNAPSSPLAALAGTELPLHAGPERSVAATKSFIAAQAAIAALVAAWTGDAELEAAVDALPALLDAAAEADWSPFVKALADARGLYTIGRGPGLSTACEAALKLKETCQIHAEAFSAAEVRHGPMALVGPGFPLLVFRQDDDGADSVDSLAQHAASRGARLFVAGAALPGTTCLPVPETPHPALAPLVQAAAFYNAVEQLARARGLDPDSPPNLQKVTETL
jgi:glucosamine--fructose-6-phosphate aminotransferase (isomerizing)